LKTITKIVAALFVSSILATAAHAGLLKSTYSECVSSLGESEGRETSDLPPATDAYAFRKSGWGLLVHLWDRRAHCISYTKLEGGDLSAAEAQAILNGYSEGNSWSKNSRGELWRSDQKAVASIKGRTISIFSAEFFTAAVLKQVLH